jgi:hypothetical protein
MKNEKYFFSVKQKNEWFGGQQIDISFFTINWMERKLELMWYFLRIIKRILKNFILSYSSHLYIT